MQSADAREIVEQKLQLSTGDAIAFLIRNFPESDLANHRISKAALLQAIYRKIYSS